MIVTSYQNNKICMLGGVYETQHFKDKYFILLSFTFVQPQPIVEFNVLF